MSIKLGNIVEDGITGITGVAYQYYTRTNGNTMIGIQPRGDGTNLLDMVFVDQFTIKVLEEGITDVPETAHTDIQIGDNVEEIVSGQVGIVTGKNVFLNGCVHFEMTTRSVDNKNPEVFWVDHTRLKIIGDGIKIKQTPETGGPFVRGMFKSR